MNAPDIIRDIVEKQGIQFSAICSYLKINKSTLSERLRQRNPSVEKMSEMLQALDYKLVAVPANTTLQDGWYDVEIEPNAKKE